MQKDALTALSAERQAIREEVQRLAEQHKRLARVLGKPFDWEAHRQHQQSLRALRERIARYRSRLGLRKRGGGGTLPDEFFLAD